jgi:hypothetical protein
LLGYMVGRVCRRVLQHCLPLVCLLVVTLALSASAASASRFSSSLQAHADRVGHTHMVQGAMTHTGGVSVSAPPEALQVGFKQRRAAAARSRGKRRVQAALLAGVCGDGRRQVGGIARSLRELLALRAHARHVLTTRQRHARSPTCTGAAWRS